MKMEDFRPPPSMSFDGNVSENWRKWRQQLTLYLSATEKDAKSDKIKSSILGTGHYLWQGGVGRI